MADSSTTGPKPRQLETLSLRLPNYMFPLSTILEEVNENDVTLDDDRPATGFPPSSPNITFSSDFDDLVCVTVGHRNVR